MGSKAITISDQSIVTTHGDDKIMFTPHMQAIILTTIIVTAFTVMYAFLKCLKQLAQICVSTRTVETQSPCTYTSLRGSANPRFVPLPDHAHGVTLIIVNPAPIRLCAIL